jgi:hypothetical protein
MLARASIALLGTYVVAALALPINASGAVSGDAPRAKSAATTLASAEPFRLEVSSTGRAQQITIRGTGFENTGHPDREQYMHWQIRRDDGSWQLCARGNDTPTATCHGAGWSADAQTLEIGGDYVRGEGFIELRVFRGLAMPDETNPARASTDWSNVLRVPVAVPGAAPTIVSLSNTTFPVGGAPADYRFFINASGIDPSVVVVFRGDVVVHPERLDGSQIQVSVPEVYRRNTPGELSLTVRTSRGGVSTPSYIRFAEQKAPVVQRTGVRVDGPAMQTPSVGTVTGRATAVTVAGAARPAASPCNPGFVWREATPQDFACVTPDTRALTSRQNADAASRRANDSGTCMSGYVWREAVPGDKVCVTPAERSRTTEDNRLAPSRTAPARP